jgi:hypothetical protein
MTEYQGNRPQRCGAFIAAVRSIEISAQASLDCYGDTPSLLRKALAEVAKQARETLAADEAAQAADQEAFARHLAELEEQRTAALSPDYRTEMARLADSIDARLGDDRADRQTIAEDAADTLHALAAATGPEPEACARGHYYHVEACGACQEREPRGPVWTRADQAAEDARHAGEPWPPGNGDPYSGQRAAGCSYHARYPTAGTGHPSCTCTDPESAHECGTPPAGAPDLNTYPARMTIAQRDPADPESWVYRCAERHASDAPGWQSPDYADMGGALSGAAEHARAMHDMGLPADMAAALARAERDAIEMADAAAQSRRESSACGQ